MNIDIKESMDNLELIILRLLSANEKVLNRDIYQASHDRCLTRIETDTSNFVQFNDTQPKNPIVIGWNPKSDRLLTADPELLIEPLPNLLGRWAEVCIIDPDLGILKWTGLKAIKKKLPKGWWSFPKTHTYQLHYRQLFMNDETETYQKSYCCFNQKKNKVVPVYCQNVPVNPSPTDRLLPVLIASTIDDFRTLWQVQITHEKQFRIGVYSTAIKELAAIRKDPKTVLGRKKPILHWVSKHLRNTSSKKQTTIPKHLRGITEFSINGINFKITEPTKPQRIY